MSREGEYISIRAYFQINGVKVSKPQSDKSIPQVEFKQLSEDTLNKIRFLKQIPYIRCRVFDNWPIDKNDNLIW